MSINNMYIIEKAIRNAKKIISKKYKNINKENKKKLTKKVFNQLLIEYETNNIIIPKSERKNKKRVYFPDDKLLPINERGNIVSEIIYNHVSEKKYYEILDYKNIYLNIDYINGKRRKQINKRKENIRYNSFYFYF